MIRVTIETDDMKCIVEDNTAITLQDALELFGNAVCGVGYRYKGELLIEEYDE